MGEEGPTYFSQSRPIHRNADGSSPPYRPLSRPRLFSRHTVCADPNQLTVSTIKENRRLTSGSVDQKTQHRPYHPCNPRVSPSRSSRAQYRGVYLRAIVALATRSPITRGKRGTYASEAVADGGTCIHAYTNHQHLSIPWEKGKGRTRADNIPSRRTNSSTLSH